MKPMVLCLCLFAQTAGAEPTGIRFDEMPIGCRIFGTYSSGEQVIDIYMGPSGRGHVMKTFQGPDGKKLIRTTTYSPAGLMLRKDWAGGKWETFSPASCLSVPGPCRYTYRNGDGARMTYSGENIVKGNQLASTGGFLGDPPFSPTISTFGRFNLQESFREGDTTFKVTKYENCYGVIS